MKKLLTVISIMIFISYGIAHADGFTNASFKGTYSGTVICEGTDTATLGIFTADGNGNWSGSCKMNRPAPFGLREVINFTFTGTYNINDDGTMTFSFTTTPSNGLTVDAEMDGVVREAEVIDGVKIVTEAIGYSRGGELPSLLPGSLTIYHAKRLPE